MKKDLIKFLKKHRANGLAHFSVNTTSDTLIFTARDNDVFEQIRLPCKLGFGEAIEKEENSNKNLNNYPFMIQVIASPISWTIAILKVLVMIPTWITAKCNTIIESVN